MDFGEFKGENGLQSPARFITANSGYPLALDKFQLIAGVPPSYNNLLDIDYARNLMTHLAAGWRLNYGVTPCIAICVKHNNPCGVAVTNPGFPGAVAQKMIQCDAESAFGGIIILNFGVTDGIAQIMAGNMPGGKAMFDSVCASGFSSGAIDIFSRKTGKCRLMSNPALSTHSDVLDTTLRLRSVSGGMLEQPNYTFLLNLDDPELKLFGERSSAAERDLIIADCICRSSKSNTITIVAGQRLLGNGSGQTKRKAAAKLAVTMAIDNGHENELKEAVAASDSFFPFTDGVEVLAAAGIRTIFSTSGSVNDALVQQFCLECGITLYQLPDAKARGFLH